MKVCPGCADGEELKDNETEWCEEHDYWSNQRKRTVEAMKRGVMKGDLDQSLYT